ncbi:MAG: hypothetical protein WC444_06740 [Candidatus Paceibacterota bacterium]
MVSKESPKYKLNKEDGKKILKGLGIACGGTAAVFLLDLLPQIDWGTYAYIVIPLASALLNAALKFFQGK